MSRWKSTNPNLNHPPSPPFIPFIGRPDVSSVPASPVPSERRASIRYKGSLETLGSRAPTPPHMVHGGEMNSNGSHYIYPPSPPQAPAALAPAPADAPSGPSSSSASKGKKAELITKDAEYFMESTFMVFQVEKCLFRIPYYLLVKESQVFGGMFNLPQSSGTGTSNGGGDTEGSSASNPIIMPDEYRKEDFRNLMKALYPSSFTLHLTLSKSEWLSVLKLSTKWYFLALRTTAISELERPSLAASPQAPVWDSPRPPTPMQLTPVQHAQTLTSIEKITYGRKYRISSWIIAGLADLIEREETLTNDDALDISADHYITTAFTIYRLREARFRGELPVDPYPSGGLHAAVLGEVYTHFAGELADVRADEGAFKIPEKEIAFEFDQPGSPPSFFENVPGVCAVPDEPWPSDGDGLDKPIIKAKAKKKKVRKEG